MIHSFAPGKILLFGEHAAVYGHPAVGSALNEGLTLVWQKDPGSKRNDDFSFTVSPIPPAYRDLAKAALGVVSTLIPDAELQNGSLDSESSMSMAGGFGSSAAFATALCRLALLQSSSGLLAPSEVWPMAHEVEKIFHTKPSGIDTGIACHGGLMAFQYRPGLELPEAVRFQTVNLCLVYGAVPRQGTTSQLVQSVREQMSAEHGIAQKAIASLGQIASDCIDALAHGIDYASFSHWCVQANKYLKQLGLASVLHEKLFTHAALMGFPGGKSSGAGAGGAFLIAVPDRDAAESLKQSLHAFAMAENIPLSCPIGILEI